MSGDWPTLDKHWQTSSVEMAEIYGDAQIDAIIAKLPSLKDGFSKDEFAGDIRDWAVGYRGLRHIAESGVEHDKHFRNIVRLADELVAAFASLPSETYSRLVSTWWQSFGQSDADEDSSVFSHVFSPNPGLFSAESQIHALMRSVILLSTAATTISENLPAPRRGRKRSVYWRALGVKALAYTYWQATGGTYPTRRNDPYEGHQYGPFRDFVLAVLEPLEGDDAATGIDRVIQTALSKKT